MAHADQSLADLARLQEVLGGALTAADPVAWWREHLPDQPLDEDGLCIAALLVAKLRFERLVNGSRAAGEWFARDAAGFTAAFRRYHESVPSPALDPWGEAHTFERWCAERG